MIDSLIILNVQTSDESTGSAPGSAGLALGISPRIPDKSQASTPGHPRSTRHKYCRPYILLLLLFLLYTVVSPKEPKEVSTGMKEEMETTPRERPPSPPPVTPNLALTREGSKTFAVSRSVSY
jgi:hypothetical protein